jgi:hypothetical protein
VTVVRGEARRSDVEGVGDELGEVSTLAATSRAYSLNAVLLLIVEVERAAPYGGGTQGKG